MLLGLFPFAIVAFSTASGMLSPCPGQQATLQASAQQWPKPTGDLKSYISSYSSAHNGVFSNCDGLTSAMPATLSSPYQAWVTDVGDWSTSLESTVSAAQSTCLALVVNIIIPTPLCPNGVSTIDGSSDSASSSVSSAAGSAPESSSSTGGVSPAIITNGPWIGAALMAGHLLTGV